MKTVRLNAIVDGRTFAVHINPNAVESVHPLDDGHVEIHLRSGRTYVLDEGIDNVTLALMEHA